jgi:hypothetical protein
MGWVKERFSEQQTYLAEVPKLWDKMRDSIGSAVIEFNEQTAETGNTLGRADCTAKGKFCVRINKVLDNSSIEIYLDESERSLNTFRGNGRSTNKRVCGYRIVQGGKNVEFFGEDGNEISVDQACEKALAEFIFTPFPKC